MRTSVCFTYQARKSRSYTQLICRFGTIQLVYSLNWNTSYSLQETHTRLALNQMVSLLDLLLPRVLTSTDRQPALGSNQAAQGKNIQEVSYQEGSKDKITHTESSGFHFIEIHQGTVVAMLTMILVLWLLLFCLRAARDHYLRLRRFRDMISKKVRERMEMRNLDLDQSPPPKGERSTIHMAQRPLLAHLPGTQVIIFPFYLTKP